MCISQALSRPHYCASLPPFIFKLLSKLLHWSKTKWRVPISVKHGVSDSISTCNLRTNRTLEVPPHTHFPQHTHTHTLHYIMISGVPGKSHMVWLPFALCSVTAITADTGISNPLNKATRFLQSITQFPKHSGFKSVVAQ